MSEKETNTSKQKDGQMSPEELKEARDKVIAFYDGEIPHLQKQFEYYDLLAKIEEAKFRRAEAVRKSAYLFAQAQAAQDEFDKEMQDVQKQEENSTKESTAGKPVQESKRPPRQLKKD